VPRDLTKAGALFVKAAEQGSPLGAYNAGWMFKNGEGVAPDPDRSARWFQKAADLGVAGAQFELGRYYSRLPPTAEHRSKARRWMQRAADQGHEQAKRYLESTKGAPS
jgi:TPR repeat protein